MKRKILKSSLLGIMGVLLTLPQAFAEETKTESLDTITVTAQKKEENLQKVPISIDLFTDRTLEDYGLNTMSDVVMQSSNVFMKTNSAESPIIIRGISSFKSAIFSPAGFYIDDVSYPLSYMSNPDLLNIERIEILKGPQGTLYGRNTLSGLVNIITKKPDNEMRGKVVLEAAKYDSDNDGMLYRTGVSLSGPIQEDKLFMGLSLQGLSSDGFMTDISNGDDKSGDKQHVDGRGTLRYTPTDELKVTVTVDGYKHEDGFGVYRLVDGSNATPRYTANSGDSDLEKNESNNAQNLTINYQGDGWNLVSVTSRLDYDVDYTSDMDFTGGAMYSDFAFADEQYSQEIRVSSDTDNPLQWLVGTYAFTEETDTLLDIYSGSMGMWNPVGDIETNGGALFSELSWQFNSQWKLTTGLRWDHQELSGTVINHNTFMTTYTFDSSTFSEDLSYDELLPKISLQYSPDPWINFYATIAKGYQVGGYNYSMVVSDDSFTYDPEYSWNYEVGAKTTFFDEKLRVNLSLFYIDITDKQLYVNNPDITAVDMAPAINNAGSTHTYGAELGIYAYPVQRLSLFATLGLLQTEIDEWTASSTLNYEGNELPYSPEYTANLGGTYRFENGIFLGADISAMGSYYGEAANGVQQDDFQLVNMRLGYETENYDIVLWTKNLFDEEYYTLLDEMTSGGLKAVEGDPLTVGVTLTYRF